MSFQLSTLAKAFLVVVAVNLVIQPLVYALAHTNPVVAAVVIYLDLFVLGLSFAALVGGHMEDVDAHNAKVEDENQRRKDARIAHEEHERRAAEQRWEAKCAEIDAQHARRVAQVHLKERQQEVARLQAEIDALRRKRLGGA